MGIFKKKNHNIEEEPIQLENTPAEIEEIDDFDAVTEPTPDISRE